METSNRKHTRAQYAHLKSSGSYTTNLRVQCTRSTIPVPDRAARGVSGAILAAGPEWASFVGV